MASRRGAAVLYGLLLCSLPSIRECYVIPYSRKFSIVSSTLPFRLRPPRLNINGHVARPFVLLRWSLPSTASGDVDRDGDGINEKDDLGGLDADSDADDDPAQFAEKSQMLGFISDYLRKEADEKSQSNGGSDVQDGNESKSESPQAGDEITEAIAVEGSDTEDDKVGDVDDYLIAIPLDACHELGLELESVQRAILYHCPVLVHACIPMAATRLPLLYVSQSSGGSRKRNDASVPAKLQEVVQQTIQRVIFDSPIEEPDESETIGVQRDDGMPDVSGINADGVRPVLVPFSTLEIDGDNNQVLCTVGDAASPGGRTLSRLVRELRNDIESQLQGWTARLPDDPAAHVTTTADAATVATTGDQRKFRPRVPFVRLPDNWDDYLDPSKDYHTSDEGGNGISPILWGQWMDDDFGDAVRMREVGVYSRRRRMEPQDSHPSEEALYRVPDFVVTLPEGNAELAKVEKTFETYQDQRIRDAEARERQLSRDESSRDQPAPTEGESAKIEMSRGPAAVEILEPPTVNTPLDKYDALFSRTLDSLESLYADDEVEANDTSVEQLTRVEDFVEAGANETVSRDATDEARDVVAVPPDATKESEERMRRVVESRARIETERELLSKRKQDKPPIEENPVFAKYKEGTLVPSSASTKRSDSPPLALPPFPSNEHVVGFWRVVRSPTGFDVEEGDSSRSDNLILRVDGTTAGGPILNTDTRQKASAGTWRLMLLNDDADDNDNAPKTANLRIRLVIPPQKQRILVMQGQLERVSMSGTDLPMAPRGTFGIPALEERASRGKALEQELEDLVYCSGTVFMEDAVTGLNRDEIGTFTLQKLLTPTDPAQYTITIPRPVRNQD